MVRISGTPDGSSTGIETGDTETTGESDQDDGAQQDRQSRDRQAVQRLKDRQAQQGRTGVDRGVPVADRSVPSAESAAIGGVAGDVVEATSAPDSVVERSFEAAAAAEKAPAQQSVGDEFDPLGAGGVDRPGQTSGKFSRRDLSIPGQQDQLEEQAETNIVDAAGGALETAADNPYKTASATLLSPVPGDELVGTPLALIAGTGAAVSGFMRYGPEIEVPSNPFDRGTNEIPVGEQFPIKETVTPDVGNPPEIQIPRNPNLGQSELPASESVRDQPEISIGGNTGTADQPTQGQPTESVVPDNFPIDPRRRQSVQERILQREAGQQVIGQQRGRGQRRENPFRERTGADEQDLQEILDIDPTTIADPESQQQQVRERRFFTGEDAVVGREALSEDVREPEVDVETGTQTEQNLSQATDALGSGSSGEVPPPPPFLREQVDQEQQQDQLDAFGEELRARPKPDLSTGAAELQETEQDVQQEVTQSLRQDVSQDLAAQTKAVPEAAAPTPTSPESTAPGFGTGPGFEIGFGEGGGESPRPRRPPDPNSDGDGDNRREDRLVFSDLRFERTIPGGEDFFGVDDGGGTR